MRSLGLFTWLVFLRREDSACVWIRAEAGVPVEGDDFHCIARHRAAVDNRLL